jgi:hypothetical protein
VKQKEKQLRLEAEELLNKLKEEHELEKQSLQHALQREFEEKNRALENVKIEDVTDSQVFIQGNQKSACGIGKADN